MEEQSDKDEKEEHTVRVWRRRMLDGHFNGSATRWFINGRQRAGGDAGE